MIAVASGLTGVGIAKASQLGHTLGSVHIFNSSPEDASAYSVLVVIMYLLAGFFFMYFVRKLVLNQALAEAGGAIDRLRVSGHVSLVATKVTARLSQKLLLGRDFIEDVDELDKEEADRLRGELFADEVSNFLGACDEDARNTVSTQPENIAMAARLQYYRVYFEKDGTAARQRQQDKALEWINRALMRDPTNPDFQIKLADILAMDNRHLEAASILERLERDDDSPQYIQQWLGYFLLFLPGRERDAISHSLKFNDRFPTDSSALFNAACGYAQLYLNEKDDASSGPATSDNRRDSLQYLRKAILHEPELALLAKKYASKGESFEAFSTDADFLRLVDEKAT